jgi:hypothetical protein
VNPSKSIIHGVCGIAVLAAVLCTMMAPDARAAGTLTVTKSPSATAGAVTGTINEREPGTGIPTGESITVIDCGADCTQNVFDYVTCPDEPGKCTPHPDTVTLTQHAADGWKFASWSGCTIVTAAGSCTRTMAASSTVSANYSDVGAPTATLTGPVEDSKLNGEIAVAATAADNVGVTHVKFFTDAVEIADDINGADGWSATFGTAGFAHAQVITVKAVAFDAAGNASVLDADDQRSYRIDRRTGLHFEAPTPAQDEWIAIGDPAARVAFAKNDDTPLDTVAFKCDLGAGLGPCASPLGASNFASDGTYTVKVKATDDATPVANAAQIARTFHVDRTAPKVELSRPGDGSVQRPSFTPVVSVTEANPAAAHAVTCSMDGAAFAGCGAISGLAGGHHTFGVKAVDKAGNETVVTHGFEVDGSAPVVAITGGPAQNEIVRTNSVKFSFTATDPSQPLTRACRVDAGFAACSSATTHARSGLTDGAHIFEVRVADAAGNVTTVRRDFVVNAVRPTVDITGGPAEGAVIRATGATFRFTATGGSVRCSIDSETAFGPCSGADSHTVTGLANGGHTFRVQVTDASNDEVGRSRTFTVDTSVAPLLKDILNPSLSSGYKAFRRYTIYKRLVLNGVPAGATVSVRCTGKKCPARSFTTTRRGNVKLVRFAKRKLRAGTTLTIRVTRDGSIGKQFAIKIRKGKPPKVTISQIP